jgi:hypothetical protein
VEIVMPEERIEYTIEISTRESEEIQKLIDKIDSADKKFKSIKADRIGREIFESQGAPIQDENEGPVGPIFRGEEESEAVSQISRPGKGKQAYQRQDIFKNLQGKVNDLEEKEEKTQNALNQLAPLIVFGGAGVAASKIISLFKPLVPYITAALIAEKFIEQIVEELLKPGGYFDRRFKLLIEKLVNPLLDRQRQADIRQGFAQVRISSFIGARGVRRGQVGTNLGGINRGQYVYDEKLERLSKGLYP